MQWAEGQTLGHDVTNWCRLRDDAATVVRVGGRFVRASEKFARSPNIRMRGARKPPRGVPGLEFLPDKVARRLDIAHLPAADVPRRLGLRLADTLLIDVTDYGRLLWTREKAATGREKLALKSVPPRTSPLAARSFTGVPRPPVPESSVCRHSLHAE